jgi:hypothetical protein
MSVMTATSIGLGAIGMLVRHRQQRAAQEGVQVERPPAS